MGLKVVKRDGKIEEYNSNKIYKAVEIASEKSGEICEIDIYSLTEKITNKIIDLKQQQISIEQIQSIVEHCLMVSKYKSTAKAYIEYRHERDIVRESKGQLLKTIESFIDQTDKSLLTENANKASTIVTTHRDLLTGLLSKHYTINHLLDKEVAKAHNNGFIHVHDADYYISPLTNCSLVNYRDMLKNGFYIGDAFIEQPKSIGVAATILTQIIQSVASAQYGK